MQQSTTRIVSDSSKILIIDDEAQIRRLLEITLESNGYAPIPTATGREGISHAAMDNPNLIILDLGLPDMDGMEVLRAIREWSNTPIMILSVRDSEPDIVQALDKGADDYLTKPFRTGELLARVRNAIRRSAEGPVASQYCFGPLEINLANHTVKKGTEPVKLTSTEFGLLALLVQNEGKVLTHRYMLEHVWGSAYAEETQYTRVYMAQLRKKLEDDPAHPKWLLTESRIGYRFVGEQ